MPTTRAGMRYHTDSGLYLTPYRAYDSRLGRWLSRDPIGEAGGLNLYGYVGCNPGSYTDPLGLLSSINCEALRKLVDYEKQHGKIRTLQEYHSLNFSNDMMGLDASFPSVGGDVTIDWMMRSAAWGATSMPGLSHWTYLFAKQYWNMMNLNSPITNLFDEAN